MSLTPDDVRNLVHHYLLDHNFLIVGAPGNRFTYQIITVQWRGAGTRTPYRWTVMLAKIPLDNQDIIIDGDVLLLVDPATRQIQTLDEYLDERVV